MRQLYLILFFISYQVAFTQGNLKEMKPAELKPLNLSPEGDLKFKKDKELYVKISDKIQKGMKPEDLSESERKVWNENDETIEDYWDIIGGGCSWYCGGGPEKVSASSQLKSQGSNTYDAGNAHDLSYKTAWVEGVPGDGVGEYLLYNFLAESPRITEIIVVNGYVKNERAYFDNGRVKRLKMYVNNKPYAILNLKDQRCEQRFKVDPLGNGNREDIEKLKGQPGWSLKFEILEVFKGLKYDDVAVSEIYFDGLDVH